MCDHVYLLNHLVLASMISTEIVIGLLPRLSPGDIVYLNFDNLYQLYVINFKPVKIVCKTVTTCIVLMRRGLCTFGAFINSFFFIFILFVV